MISAAIVYLVCAAIRINNKHDELVMTITNIMYYIGLTFPPICLLDIFKKLLTLLQVIERLPNTNSYAFDDEGIGVNVLVMILSGIFYLTICILKDMLVFHRLFHLIYTRDLKYPMRVNVDSDVQDEIEKVFTMSESDIANSNLVVKNISKLHGNFLAVNQLCLSVDRAECFGLLGVNVRN